MTKPMPGEISASTKAYTVYVEFPGFADGRRNKYTLHFDQDRMVIDFMIKWCEDFVGGETVRAPGYVEIHYGKTPIFTRRYYKLLDEKSCSA